MYRSLFARIWLVLLFYLPSTAQVEVLSHFQLQMEGADESYDVTLPGTLQQDLIKYGIIPNHFIGTNEDSVQWVSDKNWLYSTAFIVDSLDFSTAVDYRLIMGAVDTYAEVYLNGTLIARADDQFRSYSISVGKFILPGKNRLVLRMLSPTRIAHAQYLSAGINYPADNDRSVIHYSPYVRKSPYHFGWDWGPRMLSYGIGEPIRLERISGPTLEDCYVRSILHPGSATVSVSSATGYLTERGAKLTLAIIDPFQNKVDETQINATGNDSVTFEIRKPFLWYPNGAGSQDRYQLIRTITSESNHATDTLSFGIREIKLLQEKDSLGESFTFVVNGKPLYIKGANYLPHDRRFGGGGRSLEQLFREDLLPAHFNMLRVWGGGDYEMEEFYRLADQYGILIWQDFPFACSTYPNDPVFRSRVALEVRDQLTRIRNHPSIALFCGNNEILEGMNHWGWQKKYGYSDRQWKKMTEDYDSFFRKFLKNLVETYAPHVDYIHGSPISSNWGRPQSLSFGDSHYWGVWFGSEDFSIFDTRHGRFASEFGFQSFPEMKTIESILPNGCTDSLSIDHPILRHRQRSFIGNERITDYMSRTYPVPSSFRDYVYVGQILQGHGMDYALRAIRRAYPENMGALYWQLNDVWPTVSWSSIDYWGNYKAMHYKVCRAYAPTIVDLVRQDDEYRLWLVSDSTSLTGFLGIQLDAYDFCGQLLWTQGYSTTVTHTPCSKPVARIAPDHFASKQMYVCMTVTDTSGRVIAEQVFYPALPKEMRLPKSQLHTTLYAEEGRLTLRISSPVLLKDLFIETPHWQGAKYSDNYLDILPGQSYTITIEHPGISRDSSFKELRFTCLNDILLP